MNDILKDFKDDNFTKKEFIIYGVIAPLLFISLCLFASVL